MGCAIETAKVSTARPDFAALVLNAFAGRVCTRKLLRRWEACFAKPPLPLLVRLHSSPQTRAARDDSFTVSIAPPTLRLRRVSQKRNERPEFELRSASTRSGALSIAGSKSRRAVAFATPSPHRFHFSAKTFKTFSVMSIQGLPSVQGLTNTASSRIRSYFS
jgi:hypothetical protein